MNNNQKALFALLRAGLWEQGVRLLSYGPLDFDVLYELAEEQAVIGLVAAGLEHVEDRKQKKPEVIPFLSKVIYVENRNSEMNSFIEALIRRLRTEGIYALLVKGQGVAQCYERPQWRSSGDVDLLFDSLNYEKAKKFLSAFASSIDKEDLYKKHQGMKIDSWTVELHGTLRSNISRSADNYLDEIQDETFRNGVVRTWRNGATDVLLPGPDSDVIFVFAHILQHFFRSGIGLRQLCDWCRLVWTYRDKINRRLLEERLRRMRLMTEWKAFSSFVVDYLGMPAYAMPLYSKSPIWSRKAKRICSFILDVGNFGSKRDRSYMDRYPYVIYKAISLMRHAGDAIRHLFIFPIDSFRVFLRLVFAGTRAVAKGE